MKFPIDEVTTKICNIFDSKDIILCAPPGAGKSTRVPMALLSCYPKKRFLMLQPRRVVVRHLASFLASQCNEKVGESIGFIVRGENRVSSRSRLVIVTEGVLTRLLQSDPELSDFDAILFDEFHERNVHADMGLALALESQQGLREDLRIMVMSATLDQSALQQLMPNAKSIKSAGKMYDVAIHYAGDCRFEYIVDKLVSTITAALSQHSDGDVLVFLPSAATIHQCQRRLNLSQVSILPLFGALTPAQQAEALAPDPKGRRKVILATNIAETSLTIDGVTIVIDSGRAQLARYDFKTANTSLSMKMITQASAEQRKGRAGRTAPGHCYRLWSVDTQSRLAHSVRPQIKEVDITSHLLDVVAWGTDFNQLPLLDRPDDAQLEYAKKQLLRLQIVNPNGSLTVLGNHCAKTSLHPRVTAMLHLAKSDTKKDSEEDKKAAVLAATLLETSGAIPSGDYAQVMQNLERTPVPAWSKIFKQALTLADVSHFKDLTNQDELRVAAWLAIAYPERVAFRIQHNQWQMATGVRFQCEQLATSMNWCVVLHSQYVDVPNGSPQLRVFSVLACAEHYLRAHLQSEFSVSQTLHLNPAKQLCAREESRFGQIVYAAKPLTEQQKIAWDKAWIRMIQHGQHGLPANTLPFDAAARQWLARARLMAHAQPNDSVFTNITETQLLDNAQLWLADSLQTCRTIKQLEQLPWVKLLNQYLPWDARQALDKWFPAHWKVATGRDVPLEYHVEFDSNGEMTWKVLLSVKMQEMFGVSEKLFVGNKRYQVTISLLSPAMRPLQTTQDLGRFWQGSYREIAKEMRGRYPKHHWPDDPATAKPIIGTKKRNGL